MATSVELYEALKDKLGQRAAKMLADSVPGIDTRIERLELTIDRKLEAMRADLERGLKEAERSRAETSRLLLLYFLPLWVGVYGTLAALLVTIVYRT